MTNTTLREEIKKHYFFVESKTSIVDWLAKEEWSLNENALLDFIESKVKEAREEMARFISSEMYHWDQIASEKLDHVLKRAINSSK